MLTDTPSCDFGWQAPDFTLADAHDQTFSLPTLMGEKGLLIAFICNHCPYVKAIIGRLIDDAAVLKGQGVNTVAIMSNDYQNYAEDRPEKMIEFARQHNMLFPYLVDETQQVARNYGAVCTPDFFGLNAAGQLHYRGRLDDIKMGPAGDRTAELLSAMQMIASTGNGPEQQIPSMGCSIKWRD